MIRPFSSTSTDTTDTTTPPPPPATSPFPGGIDRRRPDAGIHRAEPTDVGAPAADDDATPPPLPVKIVVAGGFGAGKTTAVGAISDIEPLTTEAAMTVNAVDLDRLSDDSTKTTTTVAFDFGRVALGNDLMLYLFGSPGQDRFRFFWDELLRGAIGAVVLIDTGRFEDCFGAVSHLEHSGVPFVVVVNAFDGRIRHHPDEVRSALDISPSTPVLVADVRDREGVKGVLVTLVRHAMATATRTG